MPWPAELWIRGQHQEVVLGAGFAVCARVAAALLRVVSHSQSFTVFLKVFIFPLEICYRPCSQKSVGAVEPGRMG